MIKSKPSIGGVVKYFIWGLGVGMLISGGIVISLGGGADIARWILPIGMFFLSVPHIHRMIG